MVTVDELMDGISAGDGDGDEEDGDEDGESDAADNPPMTPEQLIAVAEFLFERSLSREEKRRVSWHGVWRGIGGIDDASRGLDPGVPLCDVLLAITRGMPHGAVTHEVATRAARIFGECVKETDVDMAVCSR